MLLFCALLVCALHKRLLFSFFSYYQTLDNDNGNTSNDDASKADDRVQDQARLHWAMLLLSSAAIAMVARNQARTAHAKN